MPATLPQFGPEIVAAFRGGDEHALERVFYERFVGLAELARADVSDAARASRLVVNVFLRAWQERATLENGAALDLFLERVTHDAALREKGRMASLHRFEAHGGVKSQHRQAAVPTIDEVWAEIKSTLHATSTDHEQLKKERKSLSKHHAAEHMAAIGTKSRFPALALGAVVVFALAVLAVVFWIPASKEEGKMTRALASEDTRTISTKAGQRGNVKLDDGTLVTLGADSRLRIPPAFPASLRVVALDGTASFTVQPNAALPFHVRAGHVTIMATGTAFDVSAYAADDRVTLRVREGAVRVTAGGQEQDVKAGSSAIVSNGNKITQPSEQELALALGWTDGQLNITDRSVKDVIPLLRRWYQLDVITAEKSLMDRKVTFRAGLDSAKAAMQAMETNASVIFDFDGKRWVLRDVTAKK
jgi:ferric-dicitrate binding protein FerR (iron transport regulator)